MENNGNGSFLPDDDDEEEHEEAGGGNGLLGFMFGNVDNSGELEVDYLDEVMFQLRLTFISSQGRFHIFM